MIAPVKTVQQIELELILAAKNGDKDALGELYEMHKNFIWRCALKIERAKSSLMTRRGLTAEDLVQVALLRFVRSVEMFDETKGFRFLTYSGRAMQNAMMHKLRYRKSDREIISVDDPDNGRIAVLSKSDVFADVAANEEYQLLHGAISKLPERNRDIVKRRLDGEKLDQIGTYYGITKERVRQIADKSIEQVAELIRNEVKA